MKLRTPSELAYVTDLSTPDAIAAALTLADKLCCKRPTFAYSDHPELWRGWVHRLLLADSLMLARKPGALAARAEANRHIAAHYGLTR